MVMSKKIKKEILNYDLNELVSKIPTDYKARERPSQNEKVALLK